MYTDPIADFLTRIRNGLQARHEAVEIPLSKTKIRLAEILKDEGFVSDYQVIQPKDAPGSIKVFLRYNQDGTPLIQKIDRVSTPGCRVYAGVEDLGERLGGISTTIVSTSMGVMTDRKAREVNAGGEVICRIY